MDRWNTGGPRHPPSFPRRRGDGPRLRRQRHRDTVFPPQARGWTAERIPRAARTTVSPAGAGMDPTTAAGATAPPSFPRRRGDGPRNPESIRPRGAFPPQARGWTLPSGECGPGSPVSPAGAGMDPEAAYSADGGARFPRRRGDGPPRGFPLSPAARFPPQARGWTLYDLAVGIAQSVSPAGAGMDLGQDDVSSEADRFPRRRGDGPRAYLAFMRHRQFPPQARGWTLAQVLAATDQHVSPAGAGMDPGQQRALPLRPRFPRRRGDGPL